MPATHPASNTATPHAPGTPRGVDRPIRIGLSNSHEEQLLDLDLSDLAVPKVNNLHVDGLKPSWFARLFHRK